LKFQIRLEAFDVFNNVNFAGPTTSTDSTAFGQLTSYVRHCPWRRHVPHRPVGHAVCVLESFQMCGAAPWGSAAGSSMRCLLLEIFVGQRHALPFP
jgi:hypothetical protein